MLPWDRYWDALQVVEMAERFGGTEEAVKLAKADAEDARLECALLGGFLFKIALQEPGTHMGRFLQKVLVNMVGDVGEMATIADRTAIQAREVTWSLGADLEALRKRLSRVDDRVDRLTPGVGDSVSARLGEALGRIELLENWLLENSVMGVSYSQDKRTAATKAGEVSGVPHPLVTIDTGGMIFQGPVPPMAQRELTKFFLAWSEKWVDGKEAGDGTGVADQSKGGGADSGGADSKAPGKSAGR